jgi:hypothetical protein
MIAATTFLSDAQLITRKRKGYPITDFQIKPPFDRGR